MNKNILWFTTLLASTVIATSVQAAPPPAFTVSPDLYCSASGSVATADEVEVTFRGAPADDCYGAFNLPNSGEGDEEDAVNDIWGSLFGTGDFEFLVKDNQIGSGSATNSLPGLGTFTLTAGNTAGIWTLDWSGLTSDLTLDIVVLGKLGGGGTTRMEYGSYIFDNEFFAAPSGAADGTYGFTFNTTGLSHFSLLVRAEPTQPVCTENCEQTIPEPGTLATLGIGMLGLGAIRRRRQRG